MYPSPTRWGTLAEARRAGKIRHLGLSNVSLKQLETARRITPHSLGGEPIQSGEPEIGRRAQACERSASPSFRVSARDGAALDSRRVKQWPKLAPLRAGGARMAACAFAVISDPATASIAHLEENTAARP